MVCLISLDWFELVWNGLKLFWIQDLDTQILDLGTEILDLVALDSQIYELGAQI